MPRARKLAIVAATATLALALAAPSARASGSGSGGALVVGDSLEVLTSPYLKRYLPGVPLTINAVGGYNSYQIFDLFEESYDPSQSVIVFDAGTNDNPAYPQILADNLAAVAATIGDRCMVVPTIHGLTVDGIDNTGKNRVVESLRRLAAGDAGARLGGRRRHPPRADAARRPAPDSRGRRLPRPADRAGDPGMPRLHVRRRRASRCWSRTGTGPGRRSWRDGRPRWPGRSRRSWPARWRRRWPAGSRPWPPRSR